MKFYDVTKEDFEMPKGSIEAINNPKFVERIAIIEHDYWQKTIHSLVDSGKIFADNLGEIEKQLVPYEQLSESAKEERRVWAWRIINELVVFTLADQMISNQYGG